MREGNKWLGVNLRKLRMGSGSTYSFRSLAFLKGGEDSVVRRFLERSSSLNFAISVSDRSATDLIRLLLLRKRKSSNEQQLSTKAKLYH